VYNDSGQSKRTVFREKDGGEIVERRLRISEVAALYHISGRTLRYYEEAGILKSHRKAYSKYREYDRAQCERLEVILLLRRLSFSVKMIAD